MTPHTQSTGEVEQSLLTLLERYQQYEINLIAEEVASGAPERATYPFTFSRFYDWLQSLVKEGTE